MNQNKKHKQQQQNNNNKMEQKSATRLGLFSGFTSEKNSFKIQKAIINPGETVQ